MGEGFGVTDYLRNLFGGGDAANTVPMTPGQSGLGIGTAMQPNQFNTDSFGTGFNAAPSALQYGQFGLSALGGLAQGYLGFQNMSLAKKQTAQAQDNWNKQWNANKQTTNAALADRQNARVAASPNAESVDSYMKKYGIQ